MDGKQITTTKKRRQVRAKAPTGAPTPRQQKRIARRLARKTGKQTGGGATNTAQVVMSTKQLQADVRHQKPGANVLTLDNQTRAITIVVPLNVLSLEGIAQAYVTKACERGFVAASATDQPYWAFAYLYKLLATYAVAGPPPVTQLPYWLLCLCQALTPKTVPFQQGQVSYKFSLSNSSYAPTSELPIGYLGYGFTWNVDNVEPGSFTDGFPNAIPAGGYTDSNGVDAFQAMIQFMAKEGVGGGVDPAAKLVPVGLVTSFAKDVSVFGVNQLSEGLGKAGVGGFASCVQLEVPIFHPLFSSFVGAPATPTLVQDRFYNQNICFSGDSLFTTVALAGMIPQPQWPFRRAPRLHAVDFLEFGDVIAQWVTGIVQAYNNDPETVLAQEVAFANAGEGKRVMQAPTGLCPLTLQEMLLLLRNVIMCAFKSSQTGVQSLYPRMPESTSDNEFVPFVSSATTCPLAILDMILPVAVIENIRALTMRTVASAKNPNDIQLYVPVLGQYALDTLNPNNYQISILEQAPINVFASTPQIFKRTVAKNGSIVSTAVAEQAISLIDGNASGLFVFINDETRLKQLIMLWNSWLSGQNILSFSSQTGQYGTELGINVLTSIGMTRHWVTENVTHQKYEKEYVDIRLEKVKAFADTVYTTRMAIIDTSQSIILSAPYEQVLNKWILPINFSESGANYSDQSIVQRWQAIMGEPYGQAISSGLDGTSLAALHASYAQKMVRGKLTPKTDWDLLFEQMASEGRGGILAGLGNMLDGFLGF